MAQVVLKSTASADLQLASQWYEKQRPGLGMEFLDRMSRLLLLIESFPNINRSVADEVRRALDRKFDFHLYYTYSPETDLAYVIAAAHGAREPEH